MDEMLDRFPQVEKPDGSRENIQYVGFTVYIFHYLVVSDPVYFCI